MLESMTTHRQTTGRHDDSPTMFFSATTNSPTRPLTDRTSHRQIKKKLTDIHRYSPTLTDCYYSWKMNERKSFFSNTMSVYSSKKIQRHKKIRYVNTLSRLTFAPYLNFQQNITSISIFALYSLYLDLAWFLITFMLKVDIGEVMRKAFKVHVLMEVSPLMRSAKWETMWQIYTLIQCEVAVSRRSNIFPYQSGSTNYFAPSLI